MNFARILYPGMWVMRKMRFRAKLALVFLVAFIPLAVIVVHEIARNHEDELTTQREMVGVELVEKVTGVIRLLQAHRGQTNMLLLGNQAAQAAVNKTRASLQDEINALSTTVAAEKRVQMRPEWASLQQRLQGFVGQLDGKDAAQSFAMHTSLIEDMAELVYGIANQSGLLFDPEPLPYLLMDMSISKLVPLREQVGRLRGAGAGLLAQPALSEEGIGRIKVLADSLAVWSRDVNFSNTILTENGFKDPTAEAATKATVDFVALTRERFKPGAPSGNPDAYFAAGTQAIEAIGAFHTRVNVVLVERLKARDANLRRQTVIIGVGSTLAVVFLFYVLFSFNLSFLWDLRQVLYFMEETAGGNLRHQTRMRGQDELSDMSHVMDAMVNNMSVMVASVRSNSALVANSGDSLVQGNRSLSDRTEQQAANLEQTSASVQELASTVRDNAQAAQASDVAAQQVRATAEQGAEDMKLAINSIEAIEASTRRMDEIVGVIDGLAFQTNILALNAAVEAARAGESGRGFAVVATEVRSLAQRSASSAKEIRQLISTSSAQVATGVQQIRAAAANITTIVEGVRGVAGNMSRISASSAEQSASLSEITTAIRQLDEITQQNAAMVEQAVNQATALQTRASVLADAVAVFKLQQGSADEAKALVEKALAMRHSGSRGDAFVREITAPQSGLFDRDMYVFALDRSGQYLAFAGNAAKVGTRVQDVPGIDGNALIEAIAQQADSAPGWVEYDIVNPGTGKVQTKMSYVVKVDGVYLGCGVYKSLVNAG